MRKTQENRPKTLLGCSVWLVLAKIASQRPEVLQYRGHGPGAWASPALDPWVPELWRGGGDFDPALPLPISCETALALECQALKCLRFARTRLYFDPFLSFLWKLSVFVHIFQMNEIIRVQMHKITRFCPYFCSNAQNYPFWSIFLFRWPKLSVLLHFCSPCTFSKNSRRSDMSKYGASEPFFQKASIL